jgi:hypothetical protein
MNNNVQHNKERIDREEGAQREKERKRTEKNTSKVMHPNKQNDNKTLAK